MDNECFIHEKEDITSFYGESKTLFSLQLVDHLMVVNVLVPWITLNDVALAILLRDIVHEISIIHDKFDWLVSHLAKNISIVLLSAVAIIFISVLSIKRPVSYLQQ